MSYGQLKIDDQTFGDVPLKIENEGGQRPILARSKVVAALGVLPIALTACNSGNDYATIPLDEARSMQVVQTTAQIDHKKFDTLVVEKKALVFPGDSPDSCIKEGTFGEEACEAFYESAKEAHFENEERYTSEVLCKIEHPACEKVDTGEGGDIIYVAKMEGFMAHPIVKNGETEIGVEPLYLKTPTSSSTYNHTSYVFINGGNGVGYYADSSTSKPVAMNYVSQTKATISPYSVPSAGAAPSATRISPPSYTPNAYSAHTEAFKMSGGSGVKLSSSPGIRSAGTSIGSKGFGSVARATSARGGSVGGRGGGA